MDTTFPMSRATKLMLQQRVCDLTAAYNAIAREMNGISDDIVPFTAHEDIRKGQTVMVRVPKRYMLRNR